MNAQGLHDGRHPTLFQLTVEFIWGKMELRKTTLLRNSITTAHIEFHGELSHSELSESVKLTCAVPPQPPSGRELRHDC